MINRDNIRMVQLRGCLRFVFEALELPGIQGRSERQDLQRDAPSQRELHSLVDDAHASFTDFPHDLVIAKGHARLGFFREKRWAAHGIELLQSPGRALNELQRVETIGKRARDGRVAIEKGLAIGLLSCAQEHKIFFNGLGKPGIIGRKGRGNHRSALGPSHTVTFRWIHVCLPNRRRSRARARIHRFLTLSSVRSIRRATSGKLNSSRWCRIRTSR